MPAKTQRKAKVTRKTTETDIQLEVNLDGCGNYKINTGIPFFDHMLSLFAKHSLFDLNLKAKGDLEVDLHHTVEDVGLCLGKAIKKALKDKAGIRRYGSADVPMMDALATVVLDLSDRPYLKYDMLRYDVVSDSFGVSQNRRKSDFDMGLMEEFMQALSSNAGIDLHITLHYGRDAHHCIESIFKALARALGEAVTLDPRIKDVMSTKGQL
jgi:imidazoleglycerol-phosphate dehydratase